MALTQYKFQQDFKGVGRKEMWDFMRDPHSLAKITPEKMKFKVLTKGLPDEMYPGMMISYQVHPLLGEKMNWITEITHVEEFECFVDEQRSGPYAIWHHEHRLVDLPDGGIRMVDIFKLQTTFRNHRGICKCPFYQETS